MNLFLLEGQLRQTGLDAIRIIEPAASSRNAPEAACGNLMWLKSARKNPGIGFIAGSRDRVDYNRFPF
jgi:hypothetical protein